MARKYSKSNFVDAVKIITPDVYLNEDLTVSSDQISFVDQVINSHVAGISLISSDEESDFLHLSSIINSNSLSAISTPEGFSRFFIKQNNLTDITPQVFDKKILRPINKSLASFDTSTSFASYVSSTLLPKFTINSPTLDADNLGVYSTTFSGTHAYFIDNLNWLYFLNTSGPVYDPSALVYDALVNKIYKGGTYTITNAIKDYQTYVWKNYYDDVLYDPDFAENGTEEYSVIDGFNTLDSDLIPDPFVSGEGTFTSGTQNLDKLKTFIDIVYSPLYIDREDTRVEDSINELLGTTDKLKSLEPAGPFHKFLRAYSYVFRDLDNTVESITTLPSIQDCPDDYLPYLASLIGWNLYGRNVESWRNQIANAANLYRKKGTKAAINEALDTILVQNPVNTSGALTELYESYIPNLLYYLLKTESSIFSFDYYTQEKAQEYGVDMYDIANMDVNIRAAVDTILKSAVERYPHLFFIRNEPFRVTILNDGLGYFGEFNPSLLAEGIYRTTDGRGVAIVGDPNFVFNYRTPNRNFPIPPWEEEKFYRNCTVTEDLLNYLGKLLQDFCVTPTYANGFVDYVKKYTIDEGNDNDLHVGNSFVFFMEDKEFPPNQDRILSNYEVSSYDALTLWNGKSSTYDFSVSGGQFSSVFFQDVSGDYSVQDIIDTLRVIDDFSPAKSVPRVRFSLGAQEYLSGIDVACPSIRWPIDEVPRASGAMSNMSTSGVNDRGTGFALGSQVWPGYNDDRSTVNHDAVPVFSRTGAKYALNEVSSAVNTSAMVVAANIPRRSLRRRDFYNTIDKRGWHSRDGWSMPSQYIYSPSSNVEYMPLGLIPSSFSFAPATPENLSGVYSRDCAIETSRRSYFGVDVSNTSYVRGSANLSFGSCDPYVRRDITPEEVVLFFWLEEEKKKNIAYAFYKENEALLSASATWLSIPNSFANLMDDVSKDKYIAPILDKRKMSVDSLGGVQSVYNDYNKYFLSGVAGSALPEILATNYIHGGPNIFSHTYGPIYKNADFIYDGSAVLHTSANLINRTLSNPVSLNLALSGSELSSIGVIEYSVTDRDIGPYFGYPEWRTDKVLSGVSFIDTSNTYPLQTPNNKFTIYKLAQDQKSTDPYLDNYLINNQSVVIEYGGHGLPRLTFDLRGQDQLKNILIPEHDFELSINYLIANNKLKEFGGGNIGAILRTKPEQYGLNAYGVFVWMPKINKWEFVDCDAFTNGEDSLNAIVSTYAHIFSGGDPETTTVPGCSLREAPPVLSKVTKDTFKTASIKFHTRNRITVPPYAYGTFSEQGSKHDVYNGRNVQVHRGVIQKTAKTQNYIIELFPLPSNPEDSYALFDKISVVDKTLNTAAKIPYDSTIPSFNKKNTSIATPTFYNSDGTRVDFNPKIIGSQDVFSTNNILKVNQPYSLNDWFGWPTNKLIFTPWANNFSAWLFKQRMLKNYPEPAGATANTLWNTDIAPYGKIPFTGPVNYSWTTIGEGYDQNALSPPARNNFLGLYWDQRKGFLSYNDWSEYITVGTQSTLDDGAAGEEGPGWGYAYWKYLNNGIEEPVRPLLGHATAGLTYALGEVPPQSTLANPFGNSFLQDGQALGNQVDPALVTASIGMPQEFNFTSRRRDDAGIFWRDHDELLSTIVDPLGHTPSSMVFKNIINIPRNPSDPELSEFGWATSAVWLEDGHGITFPPLSVYQDVERGSLIHDKTYTFSVYIAHIPNIDGQQAGLPRVDISDYASSAIITLSPIGSKTSYTRLTLNLPKTPTTGSAYITSSIQTNGHSLTGADAARVSVSSVNPQGGQVTAKSDSIQWLRLEVSLPYDAAELDLGNKTNLGLRCTIQAYNNNWDNGALPPGQQPPNLSYEYIPCKMLMWGSAFHGAPTSPEFIRYNADILGAYRYSHWGTGDYATVNTPVYQSTGDIFEREETILPREAYYKDQELYLYNKNLSGLDKLTVALPEQPNVFDKANIYKKFSLYDTSNSLYDGKVTLNADGTLLRNAWTGQVGETLSDRLLSVSGSAEGSNITTRVKGSFLPNPRELLHMFRYFNKLGKASTGYGFNTRVLTDSSGVHDSSGGSRLSYRLNPDNPSILTNGMDTTFKNYTKLDLDN